MNAGSLSKIESQPFAIALSNGAWKLLRKKTDFHDCNVEEAALNTIEQICNNDLVSEECCQNCLSRNGSSWNRLITPQISSFIKKHHPDLQLDDISLPLDLSLFTHIMAKNINYSNWCGGNAGSVHFGFEQAKMRTVSEILERTCLSQKTYKNIWSSAVAVSPELAELNAKYEALERWIITRFWLDTVGYDINCLNFIDEELFQAVTFEWEKFSAKINLFSVINPFKIPVIITQIEVLIYQKIWIFYGNGCAESLSEAGNKALMETLQFIPRNDPEFYVELMNSEEAAKKRVREWSQSSRLISGVFSTINNRNSYSIAKNTLEVINKAFIEADFCIHVEEIEECPGIFFAYSTHNENWNAITGVPIA